MSNKQTWNRANANLETAIDNYRQQVTYFDQSRNYQSRDEKRVRSIESDVEKYNLGILRSAKEKGDEVKRNMDIYLDSLRRDHQKVNDLRSHFDDEYNENRDLVDKLNQNIMDKSRLIASNNVAFDSKDKKIYVMVSLLFFMVAFSIVYLLNIVGIVSMKMVKYSAILCIVLWIGYIVWTLFWKGRLPNVEKAVDLTRATGKGIKRAAIKNLLPHYLLRPKKCPAKCTHKKDKPKYDDVVAHGHELKTDSTYNTWAKGSHNTNVDDNPNIGTHFRPKSNYDGVSKPTSYECEWRGPPVKGKSRRITTTIPCEYYPGYKYVDHSVYRF